MPDIDITANNKEVKSQLLGQKSEKGLILSRKGFHT